MACGLASYVLHHSNYTEEDEGAIKNTVLFIGTNGLCLFCSIAVLALYILVDQCILNTAIRCVVRKN